MKKRIITGILGIGLSAAVLSACEGTEKPEGRGLFEGEENGGEDPDIKIEVDIPENEIFLLFENSNAAWYREDSGFFVDTNGKVYGYSFNRDSFVSYEDYGYGEGMSFMDKLELIRLYSETDVKVDNEFIETICGYGMQVDPEAEYTSEQVACDAGQSSLYFLKDGERILIRSDGDIEKESKDKNARKLAKYYDEQRDQLKAVDYVQLFTTGEIPLDCYRCGYQEGLEGRYIFFTAEELETFAILSGLEVDHVLKSMDEFEKEGSCYFVEITNVATGGYDLKSCGLMGDKEGYRFIPAEDSVVPGDEDAVSTEVDGFFFSAAWPAAPESDWVLANGWTTLDAAIQSQGWDENALTTAMNPGLSLYDDGGVPIMPEESDHAPAIVYPAEGYMLDKKQSTNQCAVYYSDEDPGIFYRVYYDMPGADSDYFYYGVEPGDEYVFRYGGEAGVEVNGHKLYYAERYDPSDPEFDTMYYFYFMYGPDASPYALTIALPPEAMSYIADLTDDKMVKFLEQVFDL